MTRVKICGITRKEDAFTAIEAGADALGFVFDPTSPRFLSDSERARELIQSIPPFITRVAVFGALPTELPAPALLCDALQFVSGTPPVTGQWLIKVIRSEKEASAYGENALSAHALLVDALSETCLGGTGELADWDFARELVGVVPLPVILAGGLNSENVREAIRCVRPYAVDVSSGVEREPGVKDKKKIVDFLSAVREIDYGSIS